MFIVSFLLYKDMKIRSIKIFLPERKNSIDYFLYLCIIKINQGKRTAYKPRRGIFYENQGIKKADRTELLLHSRRLLPTPESFGLCKKPVLYGWRLWMEF